jgi:hypothetical protein
MNHDTGDAQQDVMQVCLNGHVITDLADLHPERRRTACDRCGAATIDRCPTCGTKLPGAASVPGLATVGTRRRGRGRHRPPQIPWSRSNGCSAACRA